jgi:hypothetical protein
MAEVCPVCEETVLEGDLGVFDGELDEGTFFVAIIETSPRNWLCCDSCNRVVCHTCCTHPKSGYCNECIARYNLHNLVREIEEAV